MPQPLSRDRPRIRSVCFLTFSDVMLDTGAERSEHFGAPPPGVVAPEPSPANRYVYTPRPNVAATSVPGSPGLSATWLIAVGGRLLPSVTKPWPSESAE